MFKTIRNMVLIFIILVLLGFSLMVAVYTIPVENAHDQIVNDEANIVDASYSIIPNFKTSKVDIYTDYIILSEASYYNKNTSLINNAMANYGIREVEHFDDYVDGDESVINEYPRYWHGNLVIIKPLLTFLDYDSIKILEMFFELVMIVSTLKLMLERNLKKYIIPFLLALFFIHMEIISLSIQFFIMFDVMLISVVTMLYYKDYLFQENRLFYYFLVVGMATAFFDLSSFPLISFGVPMIFYILMDDNSLNVKDRVLRIILFGLTWSVGYFGMWASKWVIASILLNMDVIGNAINQTFSRISTSVVDANITRSSAILNNILIYKKRVYLLIMGLIGVYYAGRIIKTRQYISKDNIKQIIPFILIAMLPFIWYALIPNHSYIHYWFAYRNLMIFFFAVFCCLELLVKKTLN